jgi:hypothetical protein
MDANDVAKLILFSAISISLLGISFQFMRLLGAVTDNIKDFRNIVRNFSILVEGFVIDQGLIRDGIKSFVNVGKRFEELMTNISKKFIGPLEVVFGFLTTIGTFLKTITKYLHRFSLFR